MRRAVRILHKILMAYFLIAMLPALFLLGLARPNLPEAGPAWLVAISVAVGVPWFLSLAYFFMAFCVSGSVRRKVVSILSGLTELDERERELTGRAARNTFLTMTGVILGCTLLAVFSMTVTRTPPDHRAIAFSLGYVSLSAEDFISVTPEPGGATRWEVHILPQSYVVPLVCLLLTQVVAFRLFSRPIRREGND
jgi:uncharacterized membrane protein